MSSNTPLDETEATRIANGAVDSIGGPRNIYRNPRMAFAFNATRNVEFEGHEVEVRYGEISTPAVVTVEGWVFEIHDDGIGLLIKPRRKLG
ncbi:MAG TPA: protein-L-isoaspartate o-methyltransferase 1 [Thermomicrobiales bacterium]|nr:protein-L-isoaspartate o-methyltransferase 1 [Thermomicrobiales bacterium]